MIKILLALKHRILPPTINFETLNEHISLDNSPFYINTSTQPWQVSSKRPRRACISAFGFSGTNAHLILEEYRPEIDDSGSSKRSASNNSLLFVLSAKREEELRTQAHNLIKWVETNENIDLADMAYTLQVGREAMDCRLAFIADKKEDLLKALQKYLDKKPLAGTLTNQVQK